jgi:uncharacterized membrane protein
MNTLLRRSGMLTLLPIVAVSLSPLYQVGVAAVLRAFIKILWKNCLLYELLHDKYSERCDRTRTTVQDVPGTFCDH